MRNDRNLGYQQWALLECAAEGTWPSVPGARPTARFTRANWEGLFGSYDVVTDVAAIFADQLFEAYPDAKVVIVERQFEAWWGSFEHQIVIGLFLPFVVRAIAIVSWITGNRSELAMQKMILGSFHARDVDEARKNAREMHRWYYAHLREIVPVERRLEFKLKDGWETFVCLSGKGGARLSIPKCE